MRAVFLGNHTVGVTVMRTLAEMGVLAGVVAHPPDQEDGIRYLSVYEQAASLCVPRLRSKGMASELVAFIADCRPDVLVVADYRYLLPTTVLECARHGGINFHPSLLPTYRGRAPVNWAILRGETKLGLTVHCIDAGMDTGDIIAQQHYYLSEDEDVGDALCKLYPLYETLTRETVTALQVGELPRQPQDHAQASAYPRRRPENGYLDFSAPARDILNLVRAVARPYPGAFAWCVGHRITFWKASRLESESSSFAVPGMVVQAASDHFVVQCGQGFLRVLDWEADPPGWRPAGGQIFSTVPPKNFPQEPFA